MKRILLIICCLSWVASAYAVEPRLVRMFEFEVRGGITMPLGGYRGGDNDVGLSLGLELRYNTEELPWDCGAFLQLDAASRNYYSQKYPGYVGVQTNRTWAYGITGDYNFRQGYRVNPFVGMGVGIASLDQEGDSKYKDITSNETFVFMPRAGIELFHHIRLTAHCMIVRRGFHTTALTIGFVIGGRPKKSD